MSNIKDISGSIINNIEFLELIGKNNQNRTVYKCKCHCGNIFKGVMSDIKSKNTKSCGCLNHKQKHIDISGFRGKYYTVLKRVENLPNNKNTRWLCLCDCGKEFVAFKGEITSGKLKSCGCKRYPRGKENPNYNHNLTDEDRLKSRDIAKYIEWRTSVYTRDNYTCKCCLQEGGKLNAHHIKSYSIFKDLQKDINNGMTLCEKCHTEFHKLFGYNNFTSEDLEKFLKDKGQQYGK